MGTRLLLMFLQDLHLAHFLMKLMAESQKQKGLKTCFVDEEILI